MKKTLQNTFVYSIFFLLYVPIAILVIYSFNDARYSMKITHFSFKWYQELLENNLLWQSAKNSLLLAITSATITSVSAALSGCIFYFYSFRTKKTIQQLMLVMIIIPDIIFAIGLLLFFHLMHVQLGFHTLLIAHICFSLPFATLIIKNRISALDKNLLLVCQDLGAYDFYSFRKIILPLIRSAMISAWLLTFTLSFDDVLISYFVSGPSFQILPLYIFSLIRTGIKPEINALCSLLFLISIGSIGLSYKYMMKKT